MKAVILNGSYRESSALEPVNQVLVDELTRMDWEVESFLLHELDIHSCRGCFGCWVRTPGVCVVDDPGREVARSVIQGDLVTFLTPVTFGGYSSELKKAVDGLICLVSPFFQEIRGEIHHQRRYERYPRLIGVGVLPRAEEESERIFKALVARNALNLHAPEHASGVLVGDRGANEIRKEIQGLFNAVGVKE